MLCAFAATIALVPQLPAHRVTGYAPGVARTSGVQMINLFGNSGVHDSLCTRCGQAAPLCPLRRIRARVHFSIACAFCQRDTLAVVSRVMARCVRRGQQEEAGRPEPEECAGRLEGGGLP